jgi:hypothetical protein
MGRGWGCCGSLLLFPSDQRKEVGRRKWSKEMLWEVVLFGKARQGDAMLIASSVLRRFHYHDVTTQPRNHNATHHDHCVVARRPTSPHWRSQQDCQVTGADLIARNFVGRYCAQSAVTLKTYRDQFWSLRVFRWRSACCSRSGKVAWLLHLAVDNVSSMCRKYAMVTSPK